MIKPIQRVMKYPLLLCELRNSTPSSHPDFRALEDAYAAVKHINVNINELKRRKDLGKRRYDEVGASQGDLSLRPGRSEAQVLKVWAEEKG